MSDHVMSVVKGGKWQHLEHQEKSIKKQAV